MILLSRQQTEAHTMNINIWVNAHRVCTVYCCIVQLVFCAAAVRLFNHLCSQRTRTTPVSHTTQLWTFTVALLALHQNTSHTFSIFSLFGSGNFLMYCCRSQVCMTMSPISVSSDHVMQYNHNRRKVGASNPITRQESRRQTILQNPRLHHSRFSDNHF